MKNHKVETPSFGPGGINSRTLRRLHNTCKALRGRPGIGGAPAVLG